MELCSREVGGRKLALWPSRCFCLSPSPRFFCPFVSSSRAWTLQLHPSNLRCLVALDGATLRVVRPTDPLRMSTPATSHSPKIPRCNPAPTHHPMCQSLLLVRDQSTRQSTRSERRRRRSEVGALGRRMTNPPWAASGALVVVGWITPHSALIGPHSDRSYLLSPRPLSSSSLPPTTPGSHLSSYPPYSLTFSSHLLLAQNVDLHSPSPLQMHARPR